MLEARTGGFKNGSHPGKNNAAAPAISVTFVLVCHARDDS
jgi:hypothetical protein